ncbi:MAG: glycoside hydrolase [Clostridia bacterium]|nr:glycoside hydrolase [Clostridia bacterium]
MKYVVSFLQNECFYGASSCLGHENPFTPNSNFSFDMRVETDNQTMPLFITNKGRYIWSDKPFAFSFKNGVLELDGEEIIVVNAGSTLKDAYLTAMKNHFPCDKKRLPEIYFKTAQYCTWMEYIYHPTQEKVLKYAQDIIDNGFEPGILIIDEGWHGRYGNWQFDLYKFPNPKQMIDKLHEMGFKVLLWVVPWVCADGYDFVCNSSKGFPFARKNAGDIFIKNKQGDIGIFKWWNGYSAMLDLRNPCAKEFLDEQLQALMKDYGVDGFKFDGGQAMCYTWLLNGDLADNTDIHAMNIAWNEYGRAYEYHEYKDTYLGGGKNCIQRLSDRSHAWHTDYNSGVDSVIPCSIVQGLIGHPFICPDMIGGGSWAYAHSPDCIVDQELFVRSSQISALFPMMQFSWAPWRVLNKENLELVKKAYKLHLSMANEIYSIVEKSFTTGEPILRAIEYNYPNQGYEKIMDEFMIGEDILVAPVSTPNTYSKDVVIPNGKWKSSFGIVYEGGKTYHIETPLSDLLWFRKIK